MKHAFADWKSDECPRMAAAMSYYTVFSLAPLVVLVLLVVGLVLDPAEVEGQLEAQMASLMGSGAAEQIKEMIQSVNRPGEGGPAAAALSLVALMLGATGAFGQLQEALNRAWEVAPDPTRGGVRALIGKRLLSLGMVGTFAFLLLVSLVLSAAVSAFGDALGVLVGGASEVVLQVVELGVSLGMITVLFAFIFRVLPDAEVAWRDVWVGAAGTAALFVGGKFLLGLYFARSDPGAAFGAAGSLALIMVWVYYSAMIVFFGAEFTQAWAVERGGGIQPEPGAVRVVEATKLIRADGEVVGED